MSSHVNVDLTWYDVSRVVFPLLVGNQRVHLLDFLLGRFGLNFSTVKSDFEVFNLLLVEFGLVFTSFFHLILLDLLVLGL